MADFTVEIDTTNNILDVEASIINALNINENNNIIETSLSETITSVLEITSSELDTIQINTEYAGTVVFASDVIGLDNYLSNFIDDYEIDCGTP